MIREADVRAAGLLAPGRDVVVLVSGGRDSTALLHLAARISGPGAVRALHVNYGLRASADADERACAELAGALGVRLAVERAEGSGDRGNLQAWARELRYDAALRLAGDADVAVGHTLSDQAETVLYRLASSPSRRALLGMRGREGRVVRPLLLYTREDTAAYCRAHALSWVEDESNGSAAFARNRIRAGLLPALRDVHPAAEANVAAVAGILRDEAEVLDGLVDDVLAGGATIELERLRGLPSPLRRLVVQRLADAAAGGFAPGAARRADEVAGLSDRGTAALDLPHGVRAIARGGVLSFTRTPHSGRRDAAR